jgi:hypothetical protein
MDHAEALALIEDAALEPGGLDRLMSGDTLESAALAGHLAGCPECTAALAATRRTAEALFVVAAETPAADLRARTLALVAEVGRPRAEFPAHGAADEGPGSTRAASARQAAAGPRRRFVLAALGAAAVFALLAAGSFVAADMQGQLDRTRQEAAHLHDLYAEIETLLQQPTARLVALQTEAGTPAGALVLDPASNEVAVLSDDLPPPPSGMEYRCWVEANGQRQAVGRMWFESGLAYWAGKNDGIATWPAGASFGVSLEEIDQPASEPAVLSGQL